MQQDICFITNKIFDEKDKRNNQTKITRRVLSAGSVKQTTGWLPGIHNHVMFSATTNQRALDKIKEPWTKSNG